MTREKAVCMQGRLIHLADKARKLHPVVWVVRDIGVTRLCAPCRDTKNSWRHTPAASTASQPVHTPSDFTLLIQGPSFRPQQASRSKFRSVTCRRSVGTVLWKLSLSHRQFPICRHCSPIGARGRLFWNSHSYCFAVYCQCITCHVAMQNSVPS